MSVSAYAVLIDRTDQGCYYLWGPLRNALFMEFAEGNEDLIASLCIDAPLDEEQKMPAMRKDLLVEVLTMAGSERRQEIHDFLQRLIEHSRHGRRRRLEGVQRSKKDVRLCSGQSGMGYVLVGLLQDKDEYVCKVAVRSAFFLSRSNRNLGFDIL